MSPVIYVTRHGQSTANLTHEFSNRGAGHPLTPLGERQAVRLGRRLAGRGLVAIHSSPMARALQTAERVAAATGACVRATEGLREQDAGELEGRSDPEGWRLYGEVLDDWLLRGRFRSRLPGGETFSDIAHRFLPLLDELAGGDDPVLLVGHGTHLAAMLPLVAGNLDPADCRRLALPNCGIIRLEEGPAGLTCRRWGRAWLSGAELAGGWRRAARRAL